MGCLDDRCMMCDDVTLMDGRVYVVRMPPGLILSNLAAVVARLARYGCVSERTRTVPVFVSL